MSLSFLSPCPSSLEDPMDGWGAPQAQGGLEALLEGRDVVHCQLHHHRWLRDGDRGHGGNADLHLGGLSVML